MSKDVYVEIAYRCPRCKERLVVEGVPRQDPKRPTIYRLRAFVPKHESYGHTCPASTRGHTLTPKRGQVNEIATQGGTP